MKKSVLRLLACLLSVILLAGLMAGCGSSAAKPAETTQPAAPAAPAQEPAAETPKETEPEPAAYEYPTLNFVVGTYHAANNSQAQLVARFCEEVTKRSDGKITFDVHYGGDLGGQTEAIENIGSDVMDLGFFSTSINTSLTPFSSMEYTFPFSTGDVPLATAIARQLVDESKFVKEEMERLNIKVLCVTTLADYQMFSMDKLTCLDDLKGMKIAYVGTYFGAILDPVGAIGIASNGSERYQNFSTGLYQGEMLSVDLHVSYGHPELCKYMLVTNLGARATMRFGINLDVWNGLDPEVQQLFDEVGREMEIEHAERIAASLDDRMADVEAAGETITYLSDEEKAEWGAAILEMNLPGQWIEEMKGLGYADAADFVAEYIDAAESHGYTFPYDVSQYK